MTHTSDKPCIVLRGPMLDPVNNERREAVAQHLPDFSILVQPTEQEVEEVIHRVEIVFGSLPDRLLSRADRLRWIQLQSAGLDRLPEDVSTAGVTVTTANGVHAEPISEHLLAMMLFFARDFPQAVSDQRDHYWRAERDQRLFELAGKRVLLLGTGAIGDAFAFRAHALGMEIIGVKRNPEHPPRIIGGEDERNPRGMPVQPGEDFSNRSSVYQRIVGHDRIADELPGSDMVVITLPETGETRHMLGAGELGLLPRHAYVFNIGRGAVIDQDALIAALSDGTIAGAALDVFDPEPLEPDSPLWDMDNVLVTTHYSGLTPAYSDRLWTIFLDNCRRFASGMPMRNVANPADGY